MIKIQKSSTLFHFLSMVLGGRMNLTPRSVVQQKDNAFRFEISSHLMACINVVSNAKRQSDLIFKVHIPTKRSNGNCDYGDHTSRLLFSCYMKECETCACRICTNIDQ